MNNTTFILNIAPATPEHLALRIELSRLPAEDLKRKILEMIEPLVRLRAPGIGVRIRLYGATDEEDLQTLQSEIDQVLYKFQP